MTNESASSLYVAAEFGQYQIVEYLISKGAKVNKAFKSGATPLVIAAGIFMLKFSN